jgi:hypothetical protein
MTFGVMLELLTVVLLAATIVACFTLHRRVAVLRQAQAEMARAIEGFNLATARAEAGILSMRQASEDAGIALQKQIDKARAVAEDLSVAVRTGDRIVNRIGQAAEAGRRG